MRKGPVEKAADYCKKEGDFVERGERSQQGTRTDLAAVAEQIRDGTSIQQVALENPGLYVKFHKGLEALKCQTYQDRKEPPKVVWLWGETGVGKTREATNCESFYIKACDSKGWLWWNGYSQQKRIILDEFDGDWPIRDLLRLLDRYPYQGQTKGGYVKINSPEIYITSDKPPLFYWTLKDLEQIWRRISVCTEVITQK